METNGFGLALIDRPPLPATGAGMALAAGCAVAAFIVVLRFSPLRARLPRLLTAGAAGGLVFQVIHLAEHFLQMGYWVARPGEAPWLSAWAGGTADGLGYVCSLVAPGAGPSLGVESLHLTGNVVFLGALASWHMARTSLHQGRLRSLSVAERVQVFHVAEHLLLVATLLLFDRPFGVSTTFGLVEGTAATAIRVWFHFAINALATGWALKAAFDTRAERRLPSEPTLVAPSYAVAGSLV